MYGKSADMPEITGERNCYGGMLLADTYEVEAQIGSGGCGAVYKAWHKRLQKHIVLKELKDSINKPLAARRNEVEALKSVRSMYIPQVFDIVSEKSNSYTVMEYIEGESFDKLLTQGKLFRASSIIKWYCQIASALETLHIRNVCHRDIKPGNIMLMPGGDVCLIDFNSALVNGNSTGTVSRSAGYASPEQMEYFKMCEDVYRGRGRNRDRAGIGAIDWKLSDIYSLGATMFHLYTGRCPPAETDYLSDFVPADVYGPADNEHLYTTPGAAEKTARRAVDIMYIIGKSMRRNPNERYASASELCFALRGLIAG